VPTTAAASLRALQRWSLDDAARRFDAEDWWYRLPLLLPDCPSGAANVLGFDGLATIAKVWIDDALVLSSDNMHVAHEARLPEGSAGRHVLLLHFSALDALLAQRRPRPRWRVPMIENQQLRWFRTTLLGRTPGWSPPAAPVGPWRDVWLEQRTAGDLEEISVSSSLRGSSGEVCVRGRWHGALAPGATWMIEVSGHGQSCASQVLAEADDQFEIHVAVPDPRLWWPHTHGEPHLYDLRLALIAHGAVTASWQLSQVGFRELEISTAPGRFELRVNGTRIFCRGACWTPLDPVSLGGDTAMLAATLNQVRVAGMNMLRVGGTMVYESEEFYDHCDAMGILVWQDFMFANMDYPEHDPAFAASVAVETDQTLRRIGAHACLALLCGNSEVEQQAAMWGAARELWNPPLFHKTLRQRAAQHCAATPYWPSSAHGGAFPHDASEGTTSYYGVGAYLRATDDARRAAPRFATECLAFANVPEDATISLMPGGAAVRVHHPAWKARTPRDLGAGWDFEDVRDHYLAALCGVQPVALRYSNHPRYLALSRIVPGEIMAATMLEWRRRDSACAGALIWFLRDLWPGAGWGVIGADGLPKAPWYYLRRALQPVAIGLSDEGGNGLAVHLINETAAVLHATVSLQVYRDGQRLLTTGQRAVTLAARDVVTLAAGSLLDAFFDLTYAYRFGPAAHDLVVARLSSLDVATIAECAYLPLGLAALQPVNPGWQAALERRTDDSLDLTLTAARYAHAVTVDFQGYQCSDQYFPLYPGTPHRVQLQPGTSTKPGRPRGQVNALNANTPLAVGL
jgi:beta-mannosidase